MINSERCYTDLVKLQTFKERFDYLVLSGVVGDTTFGWSRYLNQTFYTSKTWKLVRERIIVRDNGLDMGLDGYPISGRIIVHHLIPLTKEMIVNHDPRVIDPEFLICVSHDTHNAITYGDKSYVDRLAGPTVRFPNDTIPWRL